MTATLRRLTADSVATVVTFDSLTAAASSADVAARTITGRIAPFGVPGRTSQGLLSILAGALTWDADLRRIKLTNGHDRDAPLGYCQSIESRPDGLHATFHVAATPAGDAALLEAAEGVRDGLSVDLIDVDVDRIAGSVRAGVIACVGLCTMPAYADARVDRVAAQQHDGGTQTPASGNASTPYPAPGPAYAPPPPAAGARAPMHTDTPSTGSALTAAAAAIAGAARGDLTPAQLVAALADFTTNPASGGAAMAPQWVGDLWAEADQPRPHIDAITGPRPLTSLKVQGFAWTSPLKVDKWAGEKTAIPSNAPTLGPAEETAQRWAGGVDVDRAFLDLGSGDIIRDLLVQATNDYRAKTDLECLADLVAGATDGAAGSVAGAISVILAQLHTIRVRPTAIWVAADLFEGLAALPGPGPAYGSGSIDQTTGKLNGWTFEVDPDLTDGTVLGLNRRAATFYEKGPIGVDALDIAKGGVDEAVFGYTATLVNRAAAISNVTVTIVPAGRSTGSTGSTGSTSSV